MKLRDHLKLFFNKNKVIKVNIYSEDRRMITTVKEVKDGMVTVDDKTYMVSNELIILDNGVPTLNYFDDNKTPYNMLNGNINNVYTADQINKVLNNKVFSNMVAAMKKKDQLMSALFVVGAGLAFILIGGLYFLYDQITLVMENIGEINDILDLLKNALSTGDIG